MGGVSKRGWRRGVFLAVVALWGLWAAVARAEPSSAMVAADTLKLPLDGHLAYLDDPKGVLGIDEVARHDGFRPATPYEPGLSSGTLWYRFSALRADEAPADWILAFGEPDIDDVRVYVEKPGGGFSQTVLGRRVPAGQLQVATRLHAASLSLPQGEAATVYIRLSSLHKIRFEEAALWHPTALPYEEARRSAFHGISFGVLTVFILTYLLFGVWLRDGSMLLYAAFVVTALCRELTHSGVVVVLFPEAGRNTNYLLSAIGLFGGISVFMLMWDRILDLGKTFPIMHRLYRWGGLVMLVPILFAASEVFSLVAPPAQLIMLAASVGSIAMASILVLRQPRDVLLRFYLCAFVPVVAVWGVEVGAMVSSAIPPDLGRRMDAIATVLHLGILCVALGYRFVLTRQRQISAEVALAGERMARERQRTFVDMVTHEFKTPLAVIDSAVQVLELLVPRAPPEVASRFATIRNAVRRLVGLIETCLNSKRDETMEIQRCPVSPATIAAQAVARDQETGRGDIRAELGELPATVVADGALLGIALDALIDNARRYGPPDQTVEVAAQAQGGSILFMVRDRGPGVRPGERELIFDKHYRSPFSGSGGGFGIGLHLVKTIALMHGGTATCRPRDGGGACFVLAIPAGGAQSDMAAHVHVLGEQVADGMDRSDRQ